jgi:hypothetical protein
MILVEKRASIEGKNYQNMVIQQKKNNAKVMKKRIPYKKRLFRRLHLNQFRRS